MGEAGAIAAAVERLKVEEAEAAEAAEIAAKEREEAEAAKFAAEQANALRDGAATPQDLELAKARAKRISDYVASVDEDAAETARAAAEAKEELDGMRLEAEATWRPPMLEGEVVWKPHEGTAPIPYSTEDALVARCRRQFARQR